MGPAMFDVLGRTGHKELIKAWQIVTVIPRKVKLSKTGFRL
jgi:hypothetical protein